MLDWILEQQDVWQRLQSCRKPVVLYGMGDGAVKILRVMEQYGIRPAALFASDDFARGNLFMGYRVEKLRDIQARYDDFIIVMAFAVRDLPTVQRIRSLSQQIELVAPDVPVAGINLFTLDFVRQYEQEFARVESMLADEQSKKVLHNIVNFKLSGKLDYLFDCETPVEEAYQNILRPTDHEHFADLGAYRGDTIAELLHFAGGCERVFAFEPDEKTHKKLCLAVEQMGLAGRATCVQMAAYSHQQTLEFDSRGGRQSALREESLVTGAAGAAKPKIKLVQGQSLDNVAGVDPNVSLRTYAAQNGQLVEDVTLEGRSSAKIIARDRPRMLIAAYHRSEDLFAIPLQIAAMRPDYRFYLRHYPYIPAWDTNLYCV